MKHLFLLLVLLSSTGISFAMEAVSTKLVVYKHGETMGGEEFIAANESIVDYLATLARPTEGFKGFAYKCMVKSRMIEPTAFLPYPNTGNGTVYIRTVYDIKDCAPLAD